jgi:hypothetical protein
MPTGAPKRETKHYEPELPPEPKRPPLADGARRDMNMQIQANRNVTEETIRSAIDPGDGVTFTWKKTAGGPEVQFSGDLSRKSIDNIHKALYEKRAHSGSSWSEE